LVKAAKNDLNSRENPAEMNPNARKNIIYSLVLFALVLIVYAWRTREGANPDKSSEISYPGKVAFVGNTLDTDYRVTYLDQNNRIFKPSIDSLLAELNRSISVSEPTSEINKLNLRDTLFAPSQTLIGMLNESNRVYDLTSGAIDPSQQPLENRWAFSSSGARLQDSTELGHILSRVGLKKILVTDTLITKSNSGVALNFSHTNRGYAVDLIGAFLEAKGIKNFLVQIGSENLAKGFNEKGELWKIGLFYVSDSTGTKTGGVIALQNQAISTAGNFEEFYTKDSLRSSFKVDPRTGAPVNHGLLGATVVGPDAKTADAMAEAIMVLGLQEAIRLDTTMEGVDMLLIYNEKGGKMRQYVSPGLSSFLSFPLR
jgi:thiamine biosynthesis lipoprotein